VLVEFGLAPVLVEPNPFLLDCGQVSARRDYLDDCEGGDFAPAEHLGNPPLAGEAVASPLRFSDVFSEPGQGVGYRLPDIHHFVGAIGA